MTSKPLNKAKEQKRKDLLIKYQTQMYEDFGDGDGDYCREFKDLCVWGDVDLAIKMIKNLYENNRTTKATRSK